jgi:serine/threonine protein phosphatase 1
MTGRLLAIGDIHGCAQELEVLLRELSLGAGDTVVFVGDYIDRGPASRAVVDQMLALAARTDVTSVFLRGNHEDMCLSYIGRGGHWGEAWRLNGGAATLESYGIDPRTPGHDVLDRLPPTHVAFFEQLRLSYIQDAWLFVHAGIRPGRRLEEQDEEDLLWIRDEFITSRHGLPQTIVFGHTPHRDVLVDLPYKVGIDTGCVYGGRLTCLAPYESRLYQVAYGDRQVRESPLPSRRRSA